MRPPRPTAAATACTTALLSLLLAAPAHAQQSDTPTATIGGPNRAPAVQHDSVVSRNGAAVSVDVLANDADPDGDALAVLGGTSAGHGTVSFDGSVATYTPDEGFRGEDSFGYVAADPYGATSSGVVRIVVTDSTVALEPEAPQRVSTGVEVTAPRAVPPVAAPAPAVQPAAPVRAAAPVQQPMGPSTTPYAVPAARPATLPFTGPQDHLLPLGLGLLLAGALVARAGRRTA